SVTLLGVVFTVAEPNPTPQDPAEKRQMATRLKAEGNVKEAYELFRDLVLSDAEGRTPGDDLELAVACLRDAGLHEQFDEFIEKAVAAHPENPYVLAAAAQAYRRLPNYGTVIAGEFRRGNQRGGGEYVSSVERDRVRTLQLLVEATKHIDGVAHEVDRARIYTDLADALMWAREGQGAWRLQEKTSLAELPAYQPGHSPWGWRGGWSESTPGAPVNEEGEPVYYYVPESFDA